MCVLVCGFARMCVGVGLHKSVLLCVCVGVCMCGGEQFQPTDVSRKQEQREAI